MWKIDSPWKPTWRTPPSWISKKCYSSLTVWAIVTKFDIKIGRMEHYQYWMWKSDFLCKPTWRMPPSWISKKCCSSLTVWAIVTKFEMCKVLPTSLCVRVSIPIHRFALGSVLFCNSQLYLSYPAGRFRVRVRSSQHRLALGLVPPSTALR